MNLSIDDHGDHLRVLGRLFFTVQEASQHFRELDAALTNMRGTGRKVRVLVDLRNCPPQSLEVAGIIREQTTHLYRPADRVSILVASSILKLQLKRIHAEQQFGVFDAEDAARDFLIGEVTARAAT